MFIDLVEKDQTSGKLRVTDFKTSGSAYNLHDASLSVQLALGCKAVGTDLCQYDVLNKKNGLYQAVPGVIQPQVAEYLFERFRRAVEAIQAEIFIPPVPGEWPCNPTCYYWKKCAGKHIPDAVFAATEAAKEEKERLKAEKAREKAEAKALKVSKPRKKKPAPEEVEVPEPVSAEG
jgi:hypothetical protein